MEEMTTNTFQKLLLSYYIIIDNMGLTNIPCNRRGLMDLNSLKEIVNMEGKLYHNLYKSHFIHI